MEKMIYALAKSFNATTELKSKNYRQRASYCEAVLSHKKGNDTKLSTWVFACVRNALINYLRMTVSPIVIH